MSRTKYGVRYSNRGGDQVWTPGRSVDLSGSVGDWIVFTPSCDGIGTGATRAEAIADAAQAAGMTVEDFENQPDFDPVASDVDADSVLIGRIEAIRNHPERGGTTMSRNGKGKGKAGQEQASQAKQAAKAEEQVITTAAGPEAAAGIPEAAEAAGPDVLTVLHTVQTNVPIRLPKKAEGIRVTPRELPSERLGVPPTTPDVDAKVEAAEAAQNAPDGAAKAPAAGAAQVNPAILGVLNASKAIRVRLPKGADGLRVTTADGKTAVVWEADLKGENPLAGAGPFTAVEAGRRGRKKGEATFTPVGGTITLIGGEKAPEAPKAPDAGGTPAPAPATDQKAKREAEKAEKAKQIAERKAEREAKKAEKAAARKAAREAAQAGKRWNGHSGSRLARWMGSAGWKAAEAITVLTELGLKQAMPSVRLQIASGKQGIRGAIAEVTEAQATELRAMRAGAVARIEAEKAARKADRDQVRAKAAAEKAAERAQAAVAKAQERAEKAQAKAKEAIEAAEQAKAKAASAAA